MTLAHTDPNTKIPLMAKLPTQGKDQHGFAFTWQRCLVAIQTITGAMVEVA